MAGALAKKVNAKVLLLNHLSSINQKQKDIDNLVKQAHESSGETHVFASYDFLEVWVPHGGFDGNEKK